MKKQGWGMFVKSSVKICDECKVKAKKILFYKNKYAMLGSLFLGITTVVFLGGCTTPAKEIPTGEPKTQVTEEIREETSVWISGYG